MHPACKSKDKTKGAQKLNHSRDLVSNYKMITWRVVDCRPGLNFSGFSATGLLNHLADDDYIDEVDDDDVYDHDGLYGPHNDEDKIREIVGNEDDEMQEIMSYYDVGTVFDEVEGDEDWCLVGEM